MLVWSLPGGGSRWQYRQHRQGFKAEEEPGGARTISKKSRGPRRYRTRLGFVLQLISYSDLQEGGACRSPGVIGSTGNPEENMLMEKDRRRVITVMTVGGNQRQL